MSPFKIVCLISLSIVASDAFAQGIAQDAKPATEALRSVDPQLRADLVRRHPIKTAEYEYFAKPGRFGFYRFDIDVLKKKGEAITLKPFGGPPIEIQSNGIDVNHDRGGHVATWTGELEIPNSKRTFPVRLNFVVWAIDADGNLTRPDPNREATRRQLEFEDYSVLEESYLRRNEEIVYEPGSNSIQVPALNATFSFRPLRSATKTAEELDVVVVYEVNEDKRIYPGDDSAIEGPGNSTVPFEVERQRRLAAFDAHMDGVKRELARGNVEE